MILSMTQRTGWVLPLKQTIQVNWVIAGSHQTRFISRIHAWSQANGTVVHLYCIQSHASRFGWSTQPQVEGRRGKNGLMSNTPSSACNAAIDNTLNHSVSSSDNSDKSICNRVVISSARRMVV
jgi:hypothetical protein